MAVGGSCECGIGILIGGNTGEGRTQNSTWSLGERQQGGVQWSQPGERFCGPDCHLHHLFKPHSLP